ncbi:MAG: carboxylating nicotinate-nucleotide diphosphorylase [Candidatus Omnitrophota bacterium]|nr:carboxylating nicotinate-nucleotide diphosphorylase [Candidatus Omnitrophota bacterium]
MRQLINRALNEDAAFADVTSRSLIPVSQRSSAAVIAKHDAVVCGLAVAAMVFRRLDPSMKIQISTRDGRAVKKNQKILKLTGQTRAILAGERTALNILSHLSGIATLTRRFVKQAGPSKAKILDTRKTLPGLRDLEKMAVRCGGGTNHRRDLSDMVLIKDNHLKTAKHHSYPHMIREVRRKTSKPVEIEIETLGQLSEALAAGADMILLDNMTPAQLRRAVRLRDRLRKKCLLEASGGITLKSVRAIARTGVDRISVGALTHSPSAVDFSLEVEQRP